MSVVYPRPLCALQALHVTHVYVLEHVWVDRHCTAWGGASH